MPKYYCDYCDVYLTHDSTSVRKAHNSGRNHLTNVRDYYAGMGHDKTQDFIDNITQAIERAGGRAGPPGPPGGQFGAPRPFGNFGGPPPFGAPQRPMIGGMGGPPPQQGFGGPPGPGPSFLPQGQPPMGMGMGMNMNMSSGPSGPSSFPSSFPGPNSLPNPGMPQFGGGGGGGRSPPPGQASFGGAPQSQASFGAPPSSMSPPSQGVGMQINPQRAAALGLRG